MTLVEKALYQTQNQSPQDPLNFPVRLNDKLANLMGQEVQDDFPPTAQAAEVRSLLFEQTDAELAKWNQIKKETLPRVNQLIHTLDINVIVPD